jgi:signal transduction histidine kinase/CheY-like chemotaxis protein
LGYLAAEVVNKINPSDIHDPQEVMARAQALSLELATTISPGFEALAFKASRGIEDIYELTYICKDGSRFPAIVSITALRDDYGHIIGYLLIGTDNSVRKQVELALNKAMAVAEKANLAKSDFLSSMSHELRTPLSAILGFAQLMESGSPSPTASQRRSIDQILKAGWYLLELINEILDLALIESGKLSLSLEPISLTEVMHECQDMIEPQAQKRGISVAFPQLDIAYFVQADRTRVKQVLINLLSNAIKYNKVGGTVVVDHATSTPGRIRICVKDSGQGLTAEKLAQLFQPFNRLGQEANGEEGTGIGLVTTKRLIELMGGSIGAESSVGTGSVFWIELNLTTQRQPAGGTTISSAVADAQVQSNAQMRTLLYVEDNPANLMLIEDLIARRPDIRLLSARDGNRGIEIARVSQPDVILMDINLPGISGIKALRILAEDPATAHIPVIAISANAIPRDIEKGLQAGFFRYLTKPIKVNEFMETLDVALEFAKTQRAGANSEEKV